MITNSSSSTSESQNPFGGALGSSRRSSRSKAFRRAVINFLFLPLFFSTFLVQIFYFWRFVPSEYVVQEYLPSFVRSANSSNEATENGLCKAVLPVAYCNILLRAKYFQQFCTSNVTTEETSNLPNRYQGPPVDTDLAPFGIIEALERFISNQTSSKNRDVMDSTHNFSCSLPPERSCNVQKVSLITMGYK